jgi:heavy metal translocating P-type ATPase
VRASRINTRLTVVIMVGLLAGAVLALAGVPKFANAAWAATVVLVLAPLILTVVRALLRGQVGVDVIALLAMAGSLALGEYLAGSVIALMLAGGNALEEYAQGRAGRELEQLVSRAPREAHVRRDSHIEEVQASDVRVGDIVVVRAGEVVPVDGVVIDREATIDESTITGEPLPVNALPGRHVLSGSANAGNSFEIRAVRTAHDSTYSSIVRLVETAVARRAPMVRMADRFAVGFLAVTLFTATAAWVLSGEPVRALAVLVIATPCPLILAPPVALVAGTSRAAQHGIIVKGGAAIERLGRISTVLIDKTGTVTLGTPQVIEVRPLGDGFTSEDLLGLAGSLEQLSVHTIGESIAHAAAARRPLDVPTDVEESPGHGIAGMVREHHVVVGSRQFLHAQRITIPDVVSAVGTTQAFIAYDGSVIGVIILEDSPREDAIDLAHQLHKVGVSRVVMVTGDHAVPAHRIAAVAGISEVHANCTPQRKLAILHDLISEARPRGVVMAGDGVNDAPALAAADVGIAMGSAGATAASESAEAVILPDRVSLVAEAISIGRRSRGIALQSVVAGMALSGLGMVVAAAGYLPPVYGALAQEAIDLAVILNALRARL